MGRSRSFRIISGAFWLVLFFACLGSGLYSIQRLFLTPQMYEGRTKIMERQPGPEQGVKVYDDPVYVKQNLKVHLADIGAICSSAVVMQRTANTLQVLGISMDPVGLLRTLRVEPVPQTQILQIDVTSTNPEEAKAAADVIAAEFQKFYDETTQSAYIQSREFIEKQLMDAQKKMQHALEIQQQVSNDPIRRKQAEIDAKATSDTYLRLRMKLDEAKIKEKEVRGNSAIKVIEPAYVMPVDRKEVIFRPLMLVSFFLALLIAAKFQINFWRGVSVRKKIADKEPN